MTTASQGKQAPSATRPGPVSEREAREVAEAAREQEWKAPSFVKELFNGRVLLHLIHPFPTLDPEEAARAKPWLDRLAAFLADNVDADAIDRNSKIPQELIDGLKALGAFGIKIPREYGGLGFSQTVYNRAVSLAATAESSIGVLLSARARPRGCTPSARTPGRRTRAGS